MSNLVNLEIAGIRTALEIFNDKMLAKVRERYAAFIGNEARPQVLVRVQVVPGARFVEPRPGPLIVETTFDGSRLTYRSYTDAGWADLDRGEGELQLAPETDAENFLRVLYAHLCLREGGLVLHAAGVLRERGGFVFFGESGSGKTTTSRLSMELGYTVLSDDLVILRKRDDTYRVYGVPFRGEMMEAPRTNASGNLVGLYTLVKSQQHELIALAPSRAISRLTSCIPFVITDPTSAGRVMQICSDLVAHVPVRELHFSRDSGFWRIIDESG